MPLQKLQFRPGVNRESTTLANEGGWFESDNVRFRSGYPEKIGGWASDQGTASAALQPPANTAPLNSSSYWGVCRSLWNWINLAGYNLLGLGTSLKFYIQNGVSGFFNDITPIRATTTGTATFAATTGSSTLTVTDAVHGAQADDFVTFTNAASLGGNITATVLNAEFQIVSILNANQYTIVATATASSSDSGTGGASTVAAYQINTSSATTSVTSGWGSGGWGGYIVATQATALNGAINNSVTGSITVDSTTNFPASGLLLIETELLSYSSKTPTTFVITARGVDGTAAASHADNTVVDNATSFTGWSESPAATVAVAQLRLWSQSNYGEDCVINPRDGAMYYWANVTNPNTFNRAQEIKAGANVVTKAGTQTVDSTCPSLVNSIMVSDASRFVVAFGCNDPSDTLFPTSLDPLLIRWSDQEQFYTWNPASTNQAGDYKLSHGSKIVANIQTRQEILVLTDTAIYSMQYLGPPYVWGFQIMGDNISIIGPNAIATASNIVYWMGTDKFYMYSGRVETLPSSVRQYVYDDIDLNQADQFFASTNEGYNEVWWFYCSLGSTTINRYVVFNHLERVWSYGEMSRTAWLDSPLRNVPMATNYNQQLLYHETGNDDGTTNPPSPIEAYIQSSDFDIGDGHNFGLVSRIIPDITFDGSNGNEPMVTFAVRPRQFPGTNYGTADNPSVISTQNYIGVPTYDVQEFTEQVFVRIRGRQMAFKISSTTVGVAWQLGAPRIDVRPDGRR
jgi:hypothetical protein